MRQYGTESIAIRLPFGNTCQHPNPLTYRAHPTNTNKFYHHIALYLYLANFISRVENVDNQNSLENKKINDIKSPEQYVNFMIISVVKEILQKQTIPEQIYWNDKYGNCIDSLDFNSISSTDAMFIMALYQSALHVKDCPKIKCSLSGCSTLCLRPNCRGSYVRCYSSGLPRTNVELGKHIGTSRQFDGSTDVYLEQHGVVKQSFSHIIKIRVSELRLNIHKNGAPFILTY